MRHVGRVEERDPRALLETVELARRLLELGLPREVLEARAARRESGPERERARALLLAEPDEPLELPGERAPGES